MANKNVIKPVQSPLYDMSALGFNSGDVVTITGSGSGIGKATALAAAKSGLAVAVWDMVAAAAQATANEIETAGGRALAVTVNVTDSDAIAKAWAETLAFGCCRYLVNNAGPSSHSDDTFLSNLEASLGSMEQVTTQWLDQAASMAESIVNITSIAGNFQGGGKTIASFYPTAKSGVTGFTRFLATRYDGKPRVNAVAPGMTHSPRTSEFLDSPVVAEAVKRIPMGRPGYVEELAAAILFLLSPAASYINGVLLPVDGGWSIA